MNRINNIWPQVIAFSNLMKAVTKAARGKRQRPSVARFMYNLENELCELEAELRTDCYQPGPYRHFTIHEPKRRIISAAPFRDRVVHHALCNILEPIFERVFIPDSYACRSGKGTHAGVRHFQSCAKKSPYVLQCDIKKFNLPRQQNSWVNFGSGSCPRL